MPDSVLVCTDAVAGVSLTAYYYLLLLFIIYEYSVQLPA